MSPAPTLCESERLNLAVHVATENTLAYTHTMRQPIPSRVILAAACLVGFVVCARPVLHAASAPSAGKARTYYVAADELQWDYTPSGRDEGMGTEFDEVGKAITESGPHRIGHVYKKAIYREYTDAHCCPGKLSR